MGNKNNSTRVEGRSVTACSALSDLPFGEWVEIDGTNHGLVAYRMAADGIVIASCPSDPGETPLSVGVYVSPDEINGLRQFLSQNTKDMLPSAARSASSDCSPEI